MAKTPETSTQTEPNKARQHKATYTRKREGGWMVRVCGPNASRFGGRAIPVTRNDGGENLEIIDRKPIHSGIDDGQVIAADKGKPYALYNFEQHAREESEPEF